MSTNLFSSLPRNMALNAFSPYRPNFDCKIEITEVPPMDAQAQDWFEEALYVTRGELRVSDQDDYPKAVALYEKAAAKQHWKAMLNLASLYLNGARNVDVDTEKGVLLVEEAMKLGIPSAYDLMGTLHSSGQGVNQSTDRAFAFWQLAADMGSAHAQAFLGDSFIGFAEPGVTWANPAVGRKMLRCAAAQGHAKGTVDLLVEYRTSEDLEADLTSQLKIAQNGVRNGCDECASRTDTLFRKTQTTAIADERYSRYSVFSDYIPHYRDLRFPNLDKVLPLPPTSLPPKRAGYGGDLKMFELAKSVQYPVFVIPPEGGPAVSQTHQRVTFGFDREIPRAHTASPELASPTQPPFADPHAAPLRYLTSPGDKPSPETGIWRVSVPPEHPLAHVLNRSWAAPNQGQVHLTKGPGFPTPTK